MIKIRYLSVALMMYSASFAWGQDDFNPASPAEPGAPPVKLVVLAEPAAGGNVYGGGKYVPETSVRVSASANTNFRFVNWTDTKGHVLSESSSYTMIKGNGVDSLIAHFEYSPGSPSEPAPGTSLVYYKLTVEAGEGGSVSGGGRYQCGKSVHLSASCKTNFEFVNWTNEEGDVVSTSSQFYYTTKAYSETLTANFRFNPPGPSEPSDPILRHNIDVTCTEGGTANTSSSVVLCGGTARLTAYVNAGYAFLGWYLNGELYTTDLSFTYTMGDEDVCFEAKFEFNPDSPSEPSKPTDKQYAFYLMSEITYPDTRIDCPLYLTSLDPLRDMTFQLTFPQEAKPVWNTLELDAKAEGYTVAWEETAEENVFLIKLTGGTVPAGNTRLLNVKVDVPETVPTATSYQVKINQVSVMEEAGNTVTASTRNGRVYVYDLGDTNGDGEVNVTDGVNMVNYLQVGDPGDGSFIKEVSDVSEDGSYNVTDIVGIVGIVQEK